MYSASDHLFLRAILIVVYSFVTVPSLRTRPREDVSGDTASGPPRAHNSGPFGQIGKHGRPSLHTYPSYEASG
jgi:hypothetical protein